jgi:hypothetical protein
MFVDIAYNFSLDSHGKDPDKYSPTLRKYHKFLWSKPLPTGGELKLIDTIPNKYLSYITPNAQMEFSSDSITNSYKNSQYREISTIVKQVDYLLVESFLQKNGTIGGYLLFPSQRIDGKMNINGARGFSRVIADRFDLTLECIRLHYQGEKSPLEEVLNRYKTFFNLFSDFHGYVDFFLLNDLLNSRDSVKKFLPREDNFAKSGYPKTVDEYLIYRENSMEFIELRNQRIKNSSNRMSS